MNHRRAMASLNTVNMQSRLRFRPACPVLTCTVFDGEVASLRARTYSSSASDGRVGPYDGRGAIAPKWSASTLTLEDNAKRHETNKATVPIPDADNRQQAKIGVDGNTSSTIPRAGRNDWSAVDTKDTRSGSTFCCTTLASITKVPSPVVSTASGVESCEVICKQATSSSLDQDRIISTVVTAPPLRLAQTTCATSAEVSPRSATDVVEVTDTAQKATGPEIQATAVSECPHSPALRQQNDGHGMDEDSGEAGECGQASAVACDAAEWWREAMLPSSRRPVTRRSLVGAATASCTDLWQDRRGSERDMKGATADANSLDVRPSTAPTCDFGTELKQRGLEGYLQRRYDNNDRRFEGCLSCSKFVCVVKVVKHVFTFRMSFVLRTV